MSALWTSGEAAQATGGTAGCAWEACGVSIDSRSVAAGDLFIALAGPNFDGHDYVAAALEAGAAAAMVHRIPAGVDPAKLLVVGDTMEGLQALGCAARDRSRARIIAVTGSVGKTSTKEMLKLMLDGQGRTHASAGSFNNHWGVPLSLARMPRDAVYGIFEIGMNHPGEIGPLSRLARPHVCIITTVEAVHTAFFNSTRAIADAKAEIFEGQAEGGIAVLNRDNEHFARLQELADAHGVKVLSFGSDEDAHAMLIDCALDPASSRVSARLRGQTLAYGIGIAGKQWVMNSLAALLAVSAAGADPALAAQALGRMTAPKGRGERHYIAAAGGSVEIIDESYNASPVSMRAAIATLATALPSMAQGRRIAVLGDMLELGDQAEALHAGLAQSLLERGIDLVYTAGPLMARLHENLPEGLRGIHAADAKALSAPLRGALRAGDVVMVKGSAGSRMGLVVGTLLQIQKV